MSATGQLETTSFSFIWKIENFREKCSKPGEHLISPIFESGDCNNKTYPQWFLELYPFGRNKDCKNYVSLYLTLKPQSTFIEHVCSLEISIHNGTQIDTSTTKLSNKTKFTRLQSSWGWNEFINRNELIEKKNTLLKQGTLIISCSISDILLKKTHKVNGALISGLLSMYLTEDFSDITIVIDDKKIKVHKAILSARSKVFSAMFKNDMIETNTNLITITDVEYTVMKQFLLFLYSGKADDIEDSAKSLLPVANKYDVNDLKELCETTLIQMINTDNVCELLIIADLYNCTNLKSEAIDFIIIYMKKIFKTKGFEDLFSSHQALFKEIFDKVVEKKF